MKKIEATFLLVFGFLIFRNASLFSMQEETLEERIHAKSEIGQEMLEKRLQVKEYAEEILTKRVTVRSEDSLCIITIEDPINQIEDPIKKK